MKSGDLQVNTFFAMWLIGLLPDQQKQNNCSLTSTVNPLTVNPLTVNPLTVNPLTLNPLTLNPLTVNPLTVNPLTVNPLTVYIISVLPFWKLLVCNCMSLPMSFYICLYLCICLCPVSACLPACSLSPPACVQMFMVAQSFMHIAHNGCYMVIN